MTKKQYTRKDPSKFGGYIYESDFYTSNRGMSNMVARIISNWNFDRHCEIMAKNRDINKGRNL